MAQTHVRQSDLDLTLAQPLFFLLEGLVGELGFILDRDFEFGDEQDQDGNGRCLKESGK
jgi:hypothetical protein